MDITYLGHSCFKLRSSNATVVTDPFDKSIGLALPRMSADVVTVSHEHDDHNNVKAVSGTARRNNPFIVNAPGEYEVVGVSVFGVPTFHDDKGGEERGPNIAYSIVIDGVSIVHLGDLGHTLTDAQVSELNGVDVLLCPVGGHYTIGPKQVGEIVSALEPSYLIPMHYQTNQHDKKMFEQVGTLEDFLKDFGGEHKQMDKLSVTKNQLPEEMELVVLDEAAGGK